MAQERIEELAEELSGYNGLDTETIITVANSVSDLPDDEDSAVRFLEQAVDAARSDQEDDQEDA